MPKDLEDIYKKIDQNNRSSQKENDEIIRTINGIEKDNDKMLKEINEIKKEVKNIAFKVDTMLEILNNFTIMLADADYEEEEEDYDLDETWVPKDEEFWEDDSDESV